MKRIFAIFVLAALLCASPCPAGEVQRTVAMVGGTSITGWDISYRIATERAYGNDSVTDAAALVSLINEGIELEAAMLRGVAPTEKDISSFSDYVDENSKAPEILGKVKKAFGQDRKSYERLYLAPKIVNMKLHRFYTTDKAVHAKERARIEKAYALVAGGKTLSEAAKKSGLEYEKFYFEDKDVTAGPELQRYFPQGGAEMSDPLAALLEKMKPGELFGNILEDDYAYRVIRLVKVEGDKYLVEAITIEKQGYDELLKEDASGISVEILDPALQKSVRSRYPGLWWLKAGT